MPSDFFDKLVHVAETAIEMENAYNIVEQQCKVLGKDPEGLLQDDAALIVVQLMSQASEYLPRGEWEKLDKKFKDLISEDNPNRGKVRGIILNNVFMYVSLKRGAIELENIRSMGKLPEKFRAESWYSIQTLDDMLNYIDKNTARKGCSRSREIGQYVVSPKRLLTGHYWFGKGNLSPWMALENVNEILTLHNLSILEEKNDQIIFEFDDADTERITEFMMGVCKGIFNYIDLFNNNIETVESEEGSTTIRISYTGKEGGMENE